MWVAPCAALLRELPHVILCLIPIMVCYQGIFIILVNYDDYRVSYWLCLSGNLTFDCCHI